MGLLGSGAQMGCTVMISLGMDAMQTMGVLTVWAFACDWYCMLWMLMRTWFVLWERENFNLGRMV
jgi:hypothetical protein